MNANRMTQMTLEAIQQAQSICTGYQNNAIEPVHLLAALLQQEDGLIPQLLQRTGVNTAGLTQAAEQAVAALPHVTGSGRSADSFYISRETEQLLAEAEETAKQMQDEYVSVEHLLLTMLRSRNQSLQKLFQQYQVKEDQVLKALRDIRGNTRVTNESPEATYDVLKNTDRISQRALNSRSWIR